MKFQHKTILNGAYDLVRPEPTRNYGIHNAELQFICIGKLGAVEIMLGTGWYLRQTYQRQRVMDAHEFPPPRNISLGVHRRKPRYKGDERSNDPCRWIGCRCYQQNFYVLGDFWREPIVAGGTEWLWPALEAFYYEQFEAGPLVDLAPRFRKHPDEETSS